MLFKNNYEVLSKGIKITGKKGCSKFIKSGAKNVVVSNYETFEDEDTKGIYYGDICNHLFSKSYVNKVSTDDLVEHEAIKTFKANINGEQIWQSKYVIKREWFIYDAFNKASSNGVLVVDEDKEFCPFKSKDDLEKVLNAVRIE